MASVGNGKSAEKIEHKAPDKRAVIEHIQAHLAEELSQLSGSPDSNAGARAAEIQRQLVMFRFLPIRDYSGPDEVVVPSTLVELETGGRDTYCFLVPSGGGLIMRIDEKPIQVVTPNSPLGEKLLGRRAGEEFEVEVGGKPRKYKVKSLQ